jgi:uncharacterized integral membrane protein
MTSQAKSWGGMAALVVLGVFFAQNLQEVEIHLLWWTSNMPMIFALVFSAAIGAGAMYAFSTLRRRSAVTAARAMR